MVVLVLGAIGYSQQISCSKSVGMMCRKTPSIEHIRVVRNPMRA